MRKLKEINGKGFKIKKQYYIEDEIKYTTEEERSEALKAINKKMWTASSVNRDRIYHVYSDRSKIQLRYRKRTPDPL